MRSLYILYAIKDAVAKICLENCFSTKTQTHKTCQRDLSLSIFFNRKMWWTLRETMKRHVYLRCFSFEWALCSSKRFHEIACKVHYHNISWYSSQKFELMKENASTVERIHVVVTRHTKWPTPNVISCLPLWK